MCRKALIITALLFSGTSNAAEFIEIPVLKDSEPIGYVGLDTESNESLRVQMKGIGPWVYENMSPEKQKIFSDLIGSGHAIGIEDISRAGFLLEYDPELSVFYLKPDSGFLKARRLSLQDTGFNMMDSLKPARLSAFLNARTGVDYVETNATEDGMQPARFDTDGAVNFNGWVLEGQADYLEDSGQPWQRGDVRLIHDWPDKMARGAAGDLSYPITEFQNFQRMGGISIARNFDLQPYRITEPSGGTSFIVRTPSRVEIMINGQRVRTLQLDPGPYDISDFPLAEGSNDVSLVITDAAGRVETKNFPFLTDHNLLKAGLHEYSYNFGIESENTSRIIHYESDKPAFSAFHRYGFTDEFTGEISAQGDEDNQQTGLSATQSFSWGTVALDTVLSHSSALGYDGAAKLSYGYENAQDNHGFSASLQYKGEYFTTLGQIGENAAPAYEVAARYNSTLFHGINAGIGGRYSAERNKADKWSYNLNFNKVVSQSLSANINFQHQKEEGAGIFVGLTWVPPLSRHTVSASVDTSANSKDIRWDWRDERKWQAGLGVAKERDDVRGTGNLGFSGQRLETSIRHDITDHISSQEESSTDYRTQFLAGTALAFADGHIALSSPIPNSFVLLAPHNNLKGQSIGVNPQKNDKGEDDYQSEVDWFGPAVMHDTVPYLARSIKIDTQKLPVGYDIGPDSFVALPTYKSGTVIIVGSGANIFADGYLQFSDSTPVVFQAGMIKNIDNPSFQEQEFFTNERARFRISQLEPGQYILTLHQYPDASVTMIIPENAPVGKYNAGTLIMTGKPS